MMTLKDQAEAAGVVLDYNIEGMADNSDAYNTFIEKLGVVERFVGFTFAGTTGQASYETLTEDSGNLTVTLRNEQVNEITNAYEAIKADTYESLLLQTRHAKYLDAIEVVSVKGQPVYKFDKLKTMMVGGITLDQNSGSLDLIEFVSAYGEKNLETLGWKDVSTFIAKNINFTDDFDLNASSSLKFSADMSNWAVRIAQTGSVITGGDHANLMIASDHASILNGNESDDILIGGAGNDAVYGGEGDDILIGGGGATDTFYGGDGVDTYLFGSGDGIDRIYEDGADKTIIQFAENDKAAGVGLYRLSQHNNDLFAYYVDAEGRRLNTEEYVRIDSYFTNEAIRDSVVLELADGTELEHNLYIRLDTDKSGRTHNGSRLDDVIYAGAGTDTIYGNEGNDRLYGGDGNDTIYGNEGDDILEGNGGNDKLYGGEGDDILIGGGGATDTFYGGDGVDTYLFGSGDGIDRIYEDGADKTIIQFAENDKAAGVGLYRLSQHNNDLFAYYVDAEGRRLNTEEYVRIDSYFKDEAIRDSVVLELADGTELEHNLYIRLDTDKSGRTHNGSRLDDVIYAGAGTDKIYGYEGNDRLYGGDGTDTIYGNEGDDILEGNGGNDKLYGGEGDDILIGGGGATDTFYGGDGVDTYLFGSGDGIDRIYEDGADKTIIQFAENDKAAGVNLYRWSQHNDDLFAYYVDAEGHRLNDQEYVRIDSYFKDEAIRDSVVFQLADGTELEHALYMNHEGYNKNYTYNASALDDVIYAGTGNDVINGYEGNDRLYGGDGNDTIYGNEGDDILIGGGGATDTLYGGDGVDTYLFGSGDGIDRIYEDGADKTIIQFAENDKATGVGLYRWSHHNDDLFAYYVDAEGHRLNDQEYVRIDSYFKDEAIRDSVVFQLADGTELEHALYMNVEGSNNNYTYNASALDDVIYAGTGHDVINGYEGNDRLYGGDGNDTIYGNEGDDILEGGGGNDKLYGGEGVDTYNFSSGDGIDHIYEDGLDFTIVNLGASIKASEIEFTKSNANLIVNYLNDSGKRTGQSVTINNYYGSQALQATTLFEVVEGTIVSPDSDGGTQYVSQTIKGNDENNNLFSQEGSDTLYGYAGNDKLFGQGGHDLLDGGTGDDWLESGEGIDRYQFGFGSGSDIVVENGEELTIIDFGEDVYEVNLIAKRVDRDLLIELVDWDGNLTGDNITIKDYLFSSDYDFYKNRNALGEGLRENTFFKLADGSDYKPNLYMEGTNDSDTIYGGYETDDELIGHAGDDRLTGYGGDDYLNGGIGNDILIGDEGNDQLLGESGNDRMYGGEGKDILKGGTGSDALYGGSGSDHLYGGDEKDWLLGEDGEDVLFGGEGNDILRGGNDNDHLTGETGNDSLYGGAGSDHLYGGAGDDKLIGDSGNDVLTGGQGTDYLDGGTGTDTLYGGSGSDHLYGGDEKDWLLGDDGDDTLTGGAGNDILRGGNGSDHYIFGNGDGYDRIIEETGTEDRLQFTDGITKEQLWFSRSGHDLNINLIGENASVNISNWFGSPNSQIEVIETDAGKLVSSSVQQLVDAMSNFSIPSSQSDFIENTAADSQLLIAINESWKIK